MTDSDDKSAGIPLEVALPLTLGWTIVRHPETLVVGYLLVDAAAKGLKRRKARYNTRGTFHSKALGKRTVVKHPLPGVSSALLFGIGFKGAQALGADEDEAVAVGVATSMGADFLRTGIVPGTHVASKPATKLVDDYLKATKQGASKWIPKSLRPYISNWKIPAAELNLIKKLVDRGATLEEAVEHVAKVTLDKIERLKLKSKGVNRPVWSRPSPKMAASYDFIRKTLANKLVERPVISKGSARILEEIITATKDTLPGKLVADTVSDLKKFGFPINSTFGGKTLNPMIGKGLLGAAKGASALGVAELAAVAAATWVGVPPGEALESFDTITDEGNDLIAEWTGDTPYLTATLQGLGTYVGGSATIGATSTLASASEEDIDVAVDNFKDQIAVSNVERKLDDGPIAEFISDVSDKMMLFTPDSWKGGGYDLRDGSGFVPMNVKRVDQQGVPAWRITDRAGNVLDQEAVDGLDMEADRNDRERSWQWGRNPDYTGPKTIGMTNLSAGRDGHLVYDNNSGRYVAKIGSESFSFDPFTGQKYGDWGRFAQKTGMDMTSMSNSMNDTYPDAVEEPDMTVPGANP